MKNIRIIIFIYFEFTVTIDSNGKYFYKINLKDDAQQK
jgi:hypothetical protein